MGADIVTIDYNADIRWEQVLEVERQANRYIWEDHPCRVTFPSPAEPGGPPLPQQEGPDGDGAADGVSGGGSMRLLRHPCLRQRTGGLVKFLSCQKFREGVRLELVCGGRPWPPVPQLAAEPIHRTAAVGEARRHRRSRGTAGPGGSLPEGRCAGLEEELFRLLAEQYRDAGGGAAGAARSGGRRARRLCDAVSHTCGGRCAVFSGEGSGISMPSSIREQTCGSS